MTYDRHSDICCNQGNQKHPWAEITKVQYNYQSVITINNLKNKVDKKSLRITQLHTGF